MTLNFSIITLQEFGSLKKNSKEEKETNTHTHTHTHNATHFNIFQGKNDIVSHSFRGIGEDHTIIVKTKKINFLTITDLHNLSNSLSGV